MDHEKVVLGVEDSAGAAAAPGRHAAAAARQTAAAPLRTGQKPPHAMARAMTTAGTTSGEQLTSVDIVEATAADEMAEAAAAAAAAAGPATDTQRPGRMRQDQRHIWMARGDPWPRPIA